MEEKERISDERRGKVGNGKTKRDKKLDRKNYKVKICDDVGNSSTFFWPCDLQTVPL